jgi:hypothetical protein
LNSDSVTNLTLASDGSVSNAPVGTHPILASAASGSGLTNYNIGYSNGMMTVGAASLTITALDTNKVYGSTLNPSEFSVAGLLNGDTVSGVTLNSTGSSSNAIVGAYAIVASDATGPALTNYTIGYSNGTLTVSQAVLTATADNKSRNFGQANPALTINYSGFVNGEGTNVLDLHPVASTTATNTTPPGIHPISVAGGADDNYAFSHVAGALTIAGPASVVITNIQMLDAATLSLGGTGDAGVTYRVEKSAGLDVWETLGTTTPDGFGVFEYIDATAGTEPVRFYRLTFP